MVREGVVGRVSERFCEMDDGLGHGWEGRKGLLDEN